MVLSQYNVIFYCPNNLNLIFLCETFTNTFTRGIDIQAKLLIIFGWLLKHNLHNLLYNLSFANPIYEHAISTFMEIMFVVCNVMTLSMIILLQNFQYYFNDICIPYKIALLIYYYLQFINHNRSIEYMLKYFIK